ncbi:MAG: ATP synthase F0 subunit B [Candidatus Sulfotelmatobacter sp.]
MNSRKIIPRVCSVLLLVAWFCALPLPAQQAPAPAVKPPKQQTQTAQQPRGPGQELAYETREAAGQEADETAQFKRSASVAFIARLTGLSLGNAYFFSVLLNFFVVAVLILWLAHRCLPGIFSARTAAIQKAMQEAQKAGEEARRRLAEIEYRLTKLDGEIGMMRNAAEKEAAAEESRIQAAGQEEVRRIVEGAQQEIASAAKAARRQLTAYAADLAVGLAQRQIRIDPVTDQVLLRNFAGELGNSPNSAHGPGKDGH